MALLATEHFRANLKTAMTARGISQREIADRAQMGYPHVNRILRGKTVPGLDICDHLADAIGLDLTYLLQSPRKFAQLLHPVTPKGVA